MSLEPPVREVLDRLYEAHGRPEHPGHDDLLGTLVETILSQATTNANSERAFESLVDRFDGDWDAIRRAPTDEVVDAIEIGGLARQKAPRIQAILERLDEERGSYSLDFLRDRDRDEAQAYLEGFKGVGPKTARFTLMWAADMSLFPMDTHILRISERLGWLDEKTPSKQAHERIEPEIPSDERYEAHIAMIRHGRSICTARSPDCPDCPLRSICAHPPDDSA
jgi:endonuclease-3